MVWYDLVVKKPNFDFEKQFQELGYSLIAGVDEVGRGSLAGPIVAGAVIFLDYSKMSLLRGITDSKIISQLNREKYDRKIRKLAYDFAIGEVAEAEIDQMGIGAANILAFRRALDNLRKVDFALIDGRRFRGFTYKYLCLEKGELQSISIAAASIIAKVYRDAKMQNLPNGELYGFNENKGYGCKKHFQAIEVHGPSSYHRKTFLRKIFEYQEKTRLF